MCAVNVVVVVSGGRVETLQAAGLLHAIATGMGEPVLLACPPSAAPLAHRLDGADEVLPVAGLAGSGRAAGLPRLWWALRRRRLDAAVLCTEAPAVRATVYLAGIPRRLGCLGGLTEHLLSDRMRCPRQGNRAEAWLGLAALLGIESDGSAQPRFDPGADAAAVAEERLLASGVADGRLLVAIAPGRGYAEAASAQWSAERYAHLANRLAQRHGVGVVLIGDEADRKMAQDMRVDLAVQSIDLCGELDLCGAAAVIARCDLLVTSDTPLLHLAAAVGTPSIGLFGPTDGRQRGPYGANHRVVQALPDGVHGSASLERIRVDDVLAGIEEAL